MTRLGSMVSASAMFGLIAASAVQAQTPTPTTATSMCVGDCKNNDSVDIADLVVGVNIALGVQQLAACPAFDCMHDGTVTVTCLVQGVNNALNGCGFVTATPTATPPGGVPTATPTTNAGTVRVFTVGHLVGPLMTPDNPGSGLFNGSQLGGGNVADVMSPGPLTLVMGPQDANGVAPLTLKSDVTFSIDISLNNSCACIKFLAAGSAGSIDCDGGTAYDTTITQTKADGTKWTIQTHQGTPATQGGNGDLVLTAVFTDVIPGDACVQNCCNEVNCETATYPDPPNQFPFTTTTATASVEGTGAPFKTAGVPFDCKNFGVSGSGGALVSGVAMGSIVGPTSDSLRFSE
jgi:hypothetical protein